MDRDATGMLCTLSAEYAGKADSARRAARTKRQEARELDTIADDYQEKAGWFDEAIRALAGAVTSP